MKAPVFILTFIILICLIISCSKENTPAPPVPIDEYFRGKLNGVAFSDSVTAAINTFYPAGELFILGFHPNGGISIYLRSFVATPGERILNEYNSMGIGNSGVYYHAGGVPGNTLRGSGKVNIMEITRSYIKGTFECIAAPDSSQASLPSQVITEGEFKLKRL